MGLFDFIKKGETKKDNNKNVNSFGEPLDRLTKDGELPWGWIYANREFTEKIQSEFTYFLNNWINSRNKSPKKQYSALKSFVLYLNDAKNLCLSKGECFEKWFDCCIADYDYICIREKELKKLEENVDRLEFEYCKKEKLLNTLEEDILERIKQNEGIIQSEFLKLFDEIIISEVKSSLYQMDKNGTINREKHGRSYILTTKEG